MAAIDEGMEALQKATELPFPEFTAKLVTSTFDAVIGATIHQMDAYADLVASLAKTLKEFQAENVTDAEINVFLAENYPDSKGNTTISDSYDFNEGKALGATYNNLVDLKLKDIWDDDTSKPANPTGYSTNDFETTTATKLTSAQITDIKEGCGAFLAKNMMDNLRAMAREGMARIVIDEGEILSRLTFTVSTTDVEATRKSTYEKETKNRKFGGGIGFLGFRIGGGAKRSNLIVKTMNERTYSRVSMNAEMIGQVKIHFHTETFPPVTTGTSTE